MPKLALEIIKVWVGLCCSIILLPHILWMLTRLPQISLKTIPGLQKNYLFVYGVLVTQCNFNKLSSYYSNNIDLETWVFFFSWFGSSLASQQWT